MYRCIIVDDDRWALIDIKASFPFQKYDFDVIGEYTNAEDALQAVMRDQPDLVITDICLQSASGIDLLQACKQFSDAQFLMISGYDQFSFARDSLNNGALYYMLKPISTEEARKALDCVVTRLQESHGKQDTGTDTFKQILAYVRLNYTEPITLDSVSERFGFNKNYLSELFTKETGYGFAKYRNVIRISHAQKMLRKGSSVTETALAVGFSDIHYFSRVFKSLTGETPIEWKNRKRDGGWINF